MLPKIANPREKTLDNLTEDVMAYVDYIKDKYQQDIKNYWFLNNTWSLLRILRARDFDIVKVDRLV
jgi:hypothetical protein